MRTSLTTIRDVQDRIASSIAPSAMQSESLDPDKTRFADKLILATTRLLMRQTKQGKVYHFSLLRNLTRFRFPNSVLAPSSGWFCGEAGIA
jgi:hypothetical protein